MRIAMTFSRARCRRTAELPLCQTALPAAVNDLWLPVPRAGKKKRYNREASERRAAEQQRVLAESLGSGSRGGGEGGGVQLARLSGMAGREDSAAHLPARSASCSVHSGRLGERPPSPSTPTVATGGFAPATPQQAAMERPPQRSPSPTGSALQRASGHMQQLRQLASNPLDALRRRECQLHLTATYLPLTEQELAAMEREAGRQRGGRAAVAAMERVSTLAATSPRIANLLHRRAWGLRGGARVWRGRTGIVGHDLLAGPVCGSAWADGSQQWDGFQLMVNRLSRSDASCPLPSLPCSGVLYVYLDRAQDLASSTAQGFTRNM